MKKSVVGRGGRRNEEVEKDWRDTGALRDSCAGVSVWGFGVVVKAAGHPAPKVGGQPAYRVVS